MADIEAIFEERGVDRISSVDLVAALVEIETSPWCEFVNGKPISTRRLATLLKPFEVAPASTRIGDKTPKGYHLDEFKDAFGRYLRPNGSGVCDASRIENATTQQANIDAAASEFSNYNKEAAAAVQECGNPNKNAHCCDVAVSDPPTQARETGIEEEL